MNFMWFILLFLFTANCGSSQIINIGGIFHTDDRNLEVAFLDVVNRANNDQETLPSARLVAKIQKISSDNSFHASKAVCSLISQGVAAIFAPLKAGSRRHVQSVCSAFGIPCIHTRWDYEWELAANYSINLFPHGPTLGKAYRDLITSWNWRTFAVVYQDNEALIKLKDVFESPGYYSLKIGVMQLPDGDNFHSLWTEIKKAGYKNIIVDCHSDQIYKVLKHAQQSGLMTDGYHYLISNLDFDVGNLEEFLYSETNISLLRLVDQNFVTTLDKNQTLVMSSKNDFTFKTETALIFDAVNVMANAFEDLYKVHPLKVKPLDCNKEQKWESGNALTNFIKMGQYYGLSGSVKVDADGFRKQFVLQMMELSRQKLQQIGTYNSVYGINITNPEYNHIGIKEDIKKKHFNIVTILSNPYVMLKEEAEKFEGNDRFEGFCIDILKELAKVLDFQYTLYLTPDGIYGRKEPTTCKWNGIIGELQQGKAEMAIGDITVTSQRLEDVDFSSLFMHLGISVIFRRTPPPPPSVSLFLAPFSTALWIMIAFAYVAVSILLVFIARVSPYEWEMTGQNTEELTNNFTFLNSFWFTFGSLMKSRNSDINPSTSSTRIISAVWWFFTLIIICTYTAKLITMTTVENLHESPINDVRDLVGQTKIKYGSLYAGSTAAFFRNSKILLYNEMWANMITTQPSVFVRNNQEGIERVKRGDYAFLMESTSNEYVTERDCDLVQIGGLLDNKGYAIGLQKGSPFNSNISAVILRMHEKGTLPRLKAKWWKHKSETSCPTKHFHPHNFSGTFILMLIGLLLAVIVAVFEFLWTAKQIASNNNDSLCNTIRSLYWSRFKTTATSHVNTTEDRESHLNLSLNDDFHS